MLFNFKKKKAEKLAKEQAEKERLAKEQAEAEAKAKTKVEQEAKASKAKKVDKQSTASAAKTNTATTSKAGAKQTSAKAESAATTKTKATGKATSSASTKASKAKVEAETEKAAPKAKKTEQAPKAKSSTQQKGEIKSQQQVAEQQAKVSAALRGKFAYYRTAKGYYNYRLKASNNETIAVSGGTGYAALSGCKAGIESVRKNINAPIEDQTLKTYETLPNPKYVLFKDKAGKYRYRLYARNGELICTPEDGYSSKDACKKGIASLAKWATNSDIIAED